VSDAAVLQVAAELADRDQVGAGASHRQRAGLHLHPEEVPQPVAQPQRVDVGELAGVRARFVLAQRDAGVVLGVPDLASPPRPGVVGGVHGEVDPVQLAADALPIPTVRDLAAAPGAGAQQILLPPFHGRVHQRGSRRRAGLQRSAHVAKEGARVANLDGSAQIEQPPGGIQHLAGDRLGKVAKGQAACRPSCPEKTGPPTRARRRPRGAAAEAPPGPTARGARCPGGCGPACRR
jgi:hypothetical protein